MAPGPLGAEGPIVMTGGACGSLVAQCFHLTNAERKTLLVAGTGAGMSAVFATPLAAVLFPVTPHSAVVGLWGLAACVVAGHRRPGLSLENAFPAWKRDWSGEAW